MRRFKDGEIQLLVATTVIEVGVDVPNATLMVIENAERMGLAQLHQLRGRVGRGQHESTCLLLYRAPLSPLARERLAVMRATNDGFEVARRDLELRGPGELLGHAADRARADARRRSVARRGPAAAGANRRGDAAARLARDVAPLIGRWVGHGGAIRARRVEWRNDDPAEDRGRPRQWLPAERLGQLDLDAHLRPWLIGKGVLIGALEGAVCGERFAFRLVDQWSRLLSNSHQ